MADNIILSKLDGLKARFEEISQKITDPEVLADMKQRDLQDSTRAAAPLKAAEDAIVVDTTEMDLEQSIVFIRNLVREKLGV